jgi:hypothetical protein
MSQGITAAAAFAELRELGLSVELSEAKAARIKADLLIIEGLRLQGAYRRPDGFTSDLHLHAAYQVIAEEVIDANTPDEVVDSMIPRVVMEYARRRNWRWHLHDLDAAKRCLRGPITEWMGRKLRMQAGTGQTDSQSKFTNRAVWLRQRLKDRAWDHNDPIRHNGPDRKTVLKILKGLPVREDVLEKLALALSMKGPKIQPADIPSD